MSKSKNQACPVEEDGDEIITPMPNSCQRFSCREHHPKLENVNGFMVCPRCKTSYGDAKRQATNNLRRQKPRAPKALASAICSVKKTSRQVIERKLLTALGDESSVAILATKQDLEDMIASLYGYKLAITKGNIVSWEAHNNRCKSLADDLSQLLREAFPSNVELTPLEASKKL